MSNNYFLLEDKEHDAEYGLGFSGTKRIETQIRNGFIRKVFGIVSAQILLTTIICYYSLTSPSFLKFQIENPWTLQMAMLFVILFPCTILACMSLWRKVPQNYICLGIFTLLEAYIVGYFCAKVNPQLVCIAAAMTFLMVFSLTIYAAKTKRDISTKGSLFFIMLISIFTLALFSIFFYSRFLNLLVCTLWIFILGIYLVYDIQLIYGNRQMKLGVEDYIFGALLLYTDIIAVFLNILQTLKL
jgi:FtsH-binding integral membrane protein